MKTPTPSSGIFSRAVQGRQSCALLNAARLILVGGICLCPPGEQLKAGTIVSLSDGHEINGRLTLNASALHVDGNTAVDIKLSDVLEANFSDAPFNLNFFASTGDALDKLPPDWSEHEIGPVDVPGSVQYQTGTFTLTAASWDAAKNKDGSDHYFAVGRPWTGDGQWTIRLKAMDPPDGLFRGGFILRDNLDPYSAAIGIAAWDGNMAYVFARSQKHSTWEQTVDVDNFRNHTPIWFRMTRRGYSINFEISSDGSAWTAVKESTLPLASDIWAGFFIPSHPGATDQKIIFDRALFTPPPGRMLPSGVVLRSGSILVGHFDQFSFDASSPKGTFIRSGKTLEIAAAQVSAVVYHPVTLQQLEEKGSQSGIIMRNADFLDGTFEAINGTSVGLNSLALGLETYDLDQIAACTLNHSNPQSANYEIRLKDGSSICANSIESIQGSFLVHDVSGVDIAVDPDEIAQFRAGSSRALSLIDLRWKTRVASGAGKPSTASRAASEDGGSTQGPSPQYWTGNVQEKILLQEAGTALDFPLPGQFRALALRVAFLPHSPPNSEALFRVLADGQDFGKPVLVREGAKPQLVQIALASPRSLTFEVESTSPGVKLMLIDPVIVRN